MSVIHAKSNFGRRYSRHALFGLLFTSGAVVQAQTPPFGEFQYSTLTASGETITATRVPLVLPSGTVYKNVVMQFDVDAQGHLTITPGYPQIVPSPVPFIGNFVAGDYKGPSVDVNYLITVTGPGVTSGGATNWALATSAGATCNTLPNVANWYVFNGPMAKNPLYSRLHAAGITPQIYGMYMWGTTGEQICNTISPWFSGSLIGLAQDASGLVIASFTEAGLDKSLPVSSILYTPVTH